MNVTNAAYWVELVMASGDAGRAWVELYGRDDIAKITQATGRAIILARERRFKDANALLDTAGAAIEELTCDRPSIVHVLRRLHHGISAYQFYCVEDFDRATDGLHRADTAIREAVSLDRFLLPLTHDCPELQLHHARIARNTGRFQAMCARVAVVREMVSGRRPLCALTDGTEVDYALLASHCEPLSGYSVGAEAAVRGFAFGDVGLRCRALERFLLQLYVLPGFVVPPPPP